MSDYVIVTESTIDCGQELADEMGLVVIPMQFTLNGKEYNNYPDEREMPITKFYEALRGGGMSNTSQLSADAYIQVLSPILEEGKDVLCIVFSSGLSGTYQSCESAAEELRARFPDRKIAVVDSRCASMGQGLLCWHATQKKKNGMGLDELAEWVTENRLKLCHWFTVDDLKFLQRGGRVSAAAALVGTILSVKPVLHIDNEGHLIMINKAIGRKRSLNALVDKMEETGKDNAGQTVFISHGDCPADAEFVAGELRRRFGTKDIRINPIGPVIGCHSGPGTVAMFFMGTER